MGEGQGALGHREDEGSQGHPGVTVRSRLSAALGEEGIQAGRREDQATPSTLGCRSPCSMETDDLQI